MTLSDLKTKVGEIIPNAYFDFDNYGQVVIYTDSTVDPHTGNLVDLEIEEVQND